MRIFRPKCCRIKHLKYGALVVLAIIAVLLFVLPFVYPEYYTTGKIFQSLSFGIGMFLGKYAYRNRMKWLTKCFPMGCGRRKCIFTGTCSLDLKTILLNIDNGLPSHETMQGLKEQAIPFLDEVKFQLENSTVNTFSYFFAGSTVERFSLPFSERKHLPTVFESLCSDFDVMFCCENYTATFNQQGSIRIKALLINERMFVPGFCQLEYRDPSIGYQILDSDQFLKSVHEAVRMSKVLALPFYSCSYLCFNPIRTNINAPSVKVTVNLNEELKQFEGDIVLCIKCPQWPLSSDWRLRERLWPSLEDVQRISSKGFHLVAKPLNHEGRHLPSWRYSFSVPELELSKLACTRYCQEMFAGRESNPQGPPAANSS